MTAAAPPFVTVPVDLVEFSGWLTSSGDPLPELLEDWDYQTRLEIHGSVSTDLDAVKSAALLGNQAKLSWSASWRNLDGRVGGRATVEQATGNDVLVFTLAGDRLGPITDLHLRLVLAEETPTSSPGSAQLPGSILWEHTHRLITAGEAARFPVEIVDFESAGLDPDASWTLDVDDLERPVLGGLRLLLNSRDTALVAAVTGEGDANGIVTALHERVGAAMLDLAVRHVDDLIDWNGDEGTIGASLRQLAERADGGLRRLAELASSNPAQYYATVAGIVRRSGLGRRP